MTTALLLLPDDDPKKLRALADGPIVRVIESRTGKTREALEEVRQAAARGEFQLLAVRTVRFLGVRRFLETLVFLDRSGVRVRTIEEPWLDLGAQGDLIAMFAEMLSSERKANIAQAVAKARAHGRRAGRPRAVIPDEVFELADQGLSLRAIACRTKLGASTVQRALSARRVLHSVSSSREAV